ncbi:terephthalate 1,2-dioxygenase [Pseudonocardia sp. MH-G8]|uniref:aromatic-ring-hydroxylating dioxygenase subunit beta n=1 Tax=Pseudonocardia sp. MH-G8 TaxID=1854588 RepID=UPI000BA0A4BD|nr:terephthalate 1,2-dioxygenase [Pseudonocardia sp. MH-G8]OZM76073.1 terephthalate 1,2-dioxygenase [Pseudonocardia sp. MH-G8]
MSSPALTFRVHGAILEAQGHYVRCIDDDRLEDWPGFFVDECHYRITTADNHRRGLPAGIVWADSRGMLVDRVSALREANIYERHSYRHLLGAPAVLSAEPTPGVLSAEPTPGVLSAEPAPDGAVDVRSETSFLVVRITGDGPTDLFASGRYIDRYLVGDDRALLCERVVVCDSSRIDTLLAVPL